MVPSRGPPRPSEGQAKRVEGRQKWEDNRGFRHPESPKMVRDKKVVEPQEVENWPDNWKKAWIIIHESGYPWGLGTGAIGCIPCPLKAHAGLRKACGAIRRPL